jgi:hypothetical protein
MALLFQVAHLQHFLILLPLVAVVELLDKMAVAVPMARLVGRAVAVDITALVALVTLHQHHHHKEIMAVTLMVLTHPLTHIHQAVVVAQVRLVVRLAVCKETLARVARVQQTPYQVHL